MKNIILNLNKIKNGNKIVHIRKSDDVDKDPLEDAIGSVGKWQICFCLAVGLTRYITTWHQMAHIFLDTTPDFRCNLKLNHSSNHRERFDSKCIDDCPEYVYDRSVFTNTVVMEFNLICDKAWMADFSQFILVIGMMIGSFCVGYMGDRFGRRKPLIICLIAILLFGIVDVFAVNVLMYVIIRFCIGFIISGIVVLSYVIIVECIGVEHRELVNCLVHLPTTTGIALLGIIAYYFRSWIHLQLAITAGSVLFLLYTWIPESPRWLIVNGEPDEVQVALEKIAKCNNMPTEGLEDVIQRVRTINENCSKSKSRITDLFIPILLKDTLCVLFVWFIGGLLYYGQNFYLGKIGGNIFLNVGVCGTIQTPGLLFSIYANRKFGRRITLVAGFTAGGFCMLILIAASSIQWLRITSAILSSGFSTVAFATLYLFTSEVYPTEFRNTGVGLASTMTRIGATLSPYFANLTVYGMWVPAVVFATLSFAAAGVCLNVTETAGKKLRDTIEECSDRNPP